MRLAAPVFSSWSRRDEVTRRGPRRAPGRPCGRSFLCPPRGLGQLGRLCRPREEGRALKDGWLVEVHGRPGPAHSELFIGCSWRLRLHQPACELGRWGRGVKCTSLVSGQAGRPPQPPGAWSREAGLGQRSPCILSGTDFLLGLISAQCGLCHPNGALARLVLLDVCVLSAGLVHSSGSIYKIDE